MTKHAGEGGSIKVMKDGQWVDIGFFDLSVPVSLPGECEPHGLKKAPLGVMPYNIWRNRIPDPDLGQLVERYTKVCAAIARYRDAGIEPHTHWLEEAGLVWLYPPAFIWE